MTDSNTTAATSVIGMINRSEIEPVRTDEIARKVDFLCSEYSTAEPDQLRILTIELVEEIDALLDARNSLHDHETVIEHAAWLMLLISTLSYDLGDRDAAENAREEALLLGSELQSPSILAWGHEILTWIHISEQRWQQAIDESHRGQAIAGDSEPSGVAIQLALEEAEAWARLDDLKRMHAALETARRNRDRHDPPANPKNHFQFDPSKFDLRMMRVLLLVGEDAQAEEIAVQLQHELEQPDGTSSHPMRTSEILASRGLIAARRGDIDEAVDLTHQALDIGRKSRLSFKQITAAVTDELRKHQHKPNVDELLKRRSDLLID